MSALLYVPQHIEDRDISPDLGLVVQKLNSAWLGVPAARPGAGHPSVLAHCLVPEITLSSWHFIDLRLLLRVNSPLRNFIPAQKVLYSLMNRKPTLTLLA